MHSSTTTSVGGKTDGPAEVRRHEWRKTAIYFALGLSIFAFGLWKSFGARDPIVQAGERLPPFELQLDTGRRLSVEQGRWTWIFAGPDNLRSVAEQAVRWSRHSTARPQVLFLSQQPSPAQSSEAGMEVSLLSAVAPKVRARLGIVDGGRRILLVDPNLEVVFSSRFLRVADVDALYRRHLGLSERMPEEHRLVDFRSDLDTAPVGPTQWLVFHQGCSECSLTLGFQALIESWSRVEEFCTSPHPPCSLVVDPERNLPEIRSLLKQGNVSVPVLAVAGLNRLIRTEDRWSSEAFVVHWDESGRVVSRKALRSFLEGEANPRPTSGSLIVESSVLDLPETTTAPASRIADLSYDGEGVLGLLDGDEHLLRLVEGGKAVREFGGIGVRPEDLFYPGAFDWLPDGSVAVHDAGNGQIKLFDGTGQITRVIAPKMRTVGLVVTDDGDIVLGEPNAGTLVSRYRSGGRPQLSFGTLLDAASEIERRATNRVHLARGNAGELWVAFLHHLNVRRYSAEGVLLAEIDLDRILADRDVVLSGELPQVNFDGIQLPVKIQDVSSARNGGARPATGSLWLLLGDGTIVELTAAGTVGFLGHLRGGLSWGQIAIQETPKPRLSLAEFRGRRILELDLDSLRQRLQGAEKGELR